MPSFWQMPWTHAGVRPRPVQVDILFGSLYFAFTVLRWSRNFVTLARFFVLLLPPVLVIIFRSISWKSILYFFKIERISTVAASMFLRRVNFACVLSTPVLLRFDRHVIEVDREGSIVKGKTPPAGEDKHRFHKRGLKGWLLVAAWTKQKRNSHWAANNFSFALEGDWVLIIEHIIAIPSSFSMPLKSRPRLGPIFHLPAKRWQIELMDWGIEQFTPLYMDIGRKTG